MRISSLLVKDVFTPPVGLSKYVLASSSVCFRLSTSRYRLWITTLRWKRSLSRCMFLGWALTI